MTDLEHTKKRTEGTSHWRDRAPVMLHSDRACWRSDCAGDQPSLDRRWLWRLDSFLAVNGTTNLHRQMGRDLQQFLNETCEHHWHDYEAEHPIPAHRQCTYCAMVEIPGLADATPVTTEGEA